MIRRIMVSVVLAGIVVFGGVGGECKAKSVQPDAKKIHKEAVTIDSHVDIPDDYVNIYATKEFDLRKNHKEIQCDLYKMKKGGLDCVFLAAFNKQNVRNEANYQAAWKACNDRLDAIDRLTTIYPDKCEKAMSPRDVERIAASGRVAVVACVENGFCIGHDIKKIQDLYDRGVRYMTLSHLGNNDICDSSMPKPEYGDKGPEHNGVSKFGEQVIAEMNRLGMMVDVSHISDEAFYDVLRVSRKPVIASHSGCFALCPHPRDMKDEMMKALAEEGGVMQIVNYEGYIRLDSLERLAAIAKMEERIGYKKPSDAELKAMSKQQKKDYDKLLAKRAEEMKAIEVQYPTKPTDIKVFVDHIDHAVKVMGVDHVGIGTDFDGGGEVPGFKDESECLNVTKELLARGYSEEDIKKIWGGNLMRVWREVQERQ